jgi:hypothetical protein
MSRPLTGANRRYIYLARGLGFFLGIIAIAWGGFVLPIFWQQSLSERIARGIISGERFKPELLTQELSLLSGSEKPDFCRPAAVQSAAIMQLRITETTGGGVIKRGMDLAPLDQAIRNSLSCAPADPFLWLVLFGVESTTHGYKPDYLSYLRMSYALGPNEGWILERRNAAAIGVLELLPTDLAAVAMEEFIRLLNSQFYQRAVDTFCETTASRRELLLSKIATQPVGVREYFARSIYECGLDIKVPGVRAPRRPWQ